MTPTVKSLIVAEIKAALAAIPGVGGVIGVDAAALEQGSRSAEWEQAVRRIVGAQGEAGTYAVEMDISPDEAVESETGGARLLTMVDVWEFEVLLLIHLPEDLKPPGEADAVLPGAAAELITSAVYAIFGRLVPAVAGEQCGQWLWLAEGGDDQPLAQFTSVLARGGVALSDIGTRVTFLRSVVRYRTRKGDATSRA